MRFAVVVLSCVLVAVSAQQYNRYQPYNKYNSQFGQYNNQYGQYNNQYSRFQNQNRYNPYRTQYTKPTPFPFPPLVVSTAKPAVVTSAPVASIVVPVPEVAVKAVVPIARVASDDRSAETLKYGNEITDDGRNYYFETNNGIAVQAQISPRNYGGNPPVVSDVAQGAFSWTSPEGKVVAITYTADENGYQASGDAIPVAPEVPAQIARALAYTARFHAGVQV